MRFARDAAMLVVFVISCTSVSAPVHAALILSADTNIANAIDGGADVVTRRAIPVNPDNATFFTNLLDGNRNILLQLSNLAPSSTNDGFTAVSALYNSVPGVNSSIIDNTLQLSESLLAPIDLFFGILPLDAYTTTETELLRNFLLRGGDVFLAGDNNSLSRQNTVINDLLSELGSQMSIVNGALGRRDESTGVAPITNNIEKDSLTEGVHSFTYLVASSIDGGTALIRDATDPTKVLVASESFSVSRIPVPGMPALMIIGVMALVFVRATTVGRMQRRNTG